MVCSYPIESLNDEKKKQIKKHERRILVIEKAYEEGGDKKKCQEEMNKIKTAIRNETVMKKKHLSLNEYKERDCFDYLIKRINEIGKKHLIFGKVNCAWSKSSHCRHL